MTKRERLKLEVANTMVTTVTPQFRAFLDSTPPAYLTHRASLLPAGVPPADNPVKVVVEPVVTFEENLVLHPSTSTELDEKQPAVHYQESLPAPANTKEDEPDNLTIECTPVVEDLPVRKSSVVKPVIPAPPPVPNASSVIDTKVFPENGGTYSTKLPGDESPKINLEESDPGVVGPVPVNSSSKANQKKKSQQVNWLNATRRVRRVCPLLLRMVYYRLS